MEKPLSVLEFVHAQFHKTHGRDQRMEIYQEIEKDSWLYEETERACILLSGPFDWYNKSFTDRVTKLIQAKIKVVEHGKNH